LINPILQVSYIIINIKLYLEKCIDNAKKVYAHLESNKSGYIKTEEFVRYLNSLSNNEDFNDFFTVTTEEIISKSEKLLRKLREIKEEIKENDEETLDDLDWYNN